MVSPLQKYMMQRGMPGAGGQKPQVPGQQLAGDNSLGAGGQPAAPMGPGIADPYTEGDLGPELTNPEDGMNEFDPRRRTRPYITGLGGM